MYSITIKLGHQGAFHLVCMHLGGLGGVKPPIHFHCILHAKRRGGGPDSMSNCVHSK